MKGLDALAEIVRAAQPAIGLALQLDCQRQIRFLDVVQQLLRGALRQRREPAQLLDEPIGRGFELGIIDALCGDAPLVGLAAGNAPQRMTMSLARVIPTIFCSRAAPPDPGICPRRCSGSE